MQLDTMIPVEFNDGVRAKMQDGNIKYTFPQLRDVIEIALQATEKTTLEAPLEVVVFTDSGPSTPITLSSDVNTPVLTEVNVADARSVIIRRIDGQPVSTDDIISLEVKACEEGMNIAHI